VDDTRALGTGENHTKHSGDIRFANPVAEQKRACLPWRSTVENVRDNASPEQIKVVRVRDFRKGLQKLRTFADANRGNVITQLPALIGRHPRFHSETFASDDSTQISPCEGSILNPPRF
jgi:hypothetical protein